MTNSIKYTGQELFDAMCDMCNDATLYVVPMSHDTFMYAQTQFTIELERIMNEVNLRNDIEGAKNNAGV